MYSTMEEKLKIQKGLDKVRKGKDVRGLIVKSTRLLVNHVIRFLEGKMN